MPSSRSVVDQLINAVFDDPQDITRRLVLADALVEEEDPRAELIIEQHRREKNGQKTPGAQEKALIKKHSNALLGALRPFLRQPKFKRGFVSDAVVVGGAIDTSAAAGLREWATLERLDVRLARREVAEELLSMKALTSLVSVSGAQAEWLEEIVRRRGVLPWTTLANVPDYLTTGPSGGWDLLATMDRAFPKLETVSLAGSAMTEFTLEDYAPLFETKLISSLRELDLQIAREDVEGLFALTRNSALERISCRTTSGAFVLDVAAGTLTTPPELE